MKRIITALAVLWMLPSCNLPFEEKYPSMAVDAEEFPLSIDGGSFAVYVYYDGAWNVSVPEDVDWLTLESASGKGIGYFTVSYDEAIPQDRSTTATVTNDKGERKEIVFSQKARIIPVKEVTINAEKEIEIEHDAPQLIFTATVTPSDATTLTIRWSTSDKNIATIDQDGALTVTGRGSVWVKASCGDKADSCKVTITAPVRGLSLDRTEATVYENGVLQLKGIFNPVFANNQNLTWTCEPEGIVSVDSNGLVKAIAKGNTIVTATSDEGGFKARCTITVMESTQVDAGFGNGNEDFKDDDYIWEN